MSIMSLHGKHYYITFKETEQRDKVLDYLCKQKEFFNDTFFLVFNNKPIIWSEAKCGEFRGEKLKAWERVKRYAQKVRKE